MVSTSPTFGVSGTTLRLVISNCAGEVVVPGGVVGGAVGDVVLGVSVIHPKNSRVISATSTNFLTAFFFMLLDFTRSIIIPFGIKMSSERVSFLK